MVHCPAVKRVVLLILLYAAVFTAVFVMLAALSYLVLLASHVPSKNELALILQETQRVLRLNAVGASLLAAVLICFRGNRVLKARSVLVLVPTAATTAMVLLSLFLSSRIPFSDRAELSADSFFLAGRLNRMDDGFLFVERVYEDQLRNVVLIETPGGVGSDAESVVLPIESMPQGLTHLPSVYAVSDPTLPAATLHSYTTNEEVARRSLPVFASALRPPKVIAVFLQEFRAFVSEIEELYNLNVWPAAAAAVCFAFGIAASSLLLRLTDWRLCNTVLYLSAVRLLFYILYVARVRVVDELVKQADLQQIPALLLRLGPAAFLVVLGLVFVLVDALFAAGRQ